MAWTLAATVSGGFAGSQIGHVDRQPWVFRDVSTAYAWDGSSPSLRWSHQFPSSLSGAQMLCTSGPYVAIGVRAHKELEVRVLRRQDGRLVWQKRDAKVRPEDGMAATETAIAVRGAREREDRVIRFDLATGDVIDERPSTSGSLLVAAGGKLFIGGGPRPLAVLADGDAAPRVLSADAPMKRLITHAGGLFGYHNAQGFHGDSIVVGFDAETEKEVGRIDLGFDGAVVQLFPGPAPGQVLAAPTRHPSLLLLDVVARKVLWSREVPTEIYRCVVTPHGVVGCLGMSWRLFAFDAATGEPTTPPREEGPGHVDAYWTGDGRLLIAGTSIDCYRWT